MIRDGQRPRIAARDLVAGDVVVAAEGDRVPADTVLLEAANLAMDESLLTRESLSVRKGVANTVSHDARPGGDDSPNILSGSLRFEAREWRALL